MTTTATRTIRIIVDSSDSQRQINQVNNQLDQTTRSANTASFSLNKLAAAIGGIVATQQLKDLSDAWILVQNQLGRTSESTAALAATTATLLQVSNETRQGLQGTVDLYGSLRMSTERLGYSQEQAISMTKTINQLLLVGGKSAAQTAGAMTQLAQGLQSGALRGDEFNSVAEGAPDIMRALQKELNITQGELREFAATGGITADILAKAITNYSDEAAKAAAKTTATFAQNSEVAKNNAIAWVGASDLILGANQVAGESLVFLSQNISKLVDIAGVAAGIYVARLIPAIIAGTTAMGANIAATVASTFETIRYNTALANLAVNATIAQRATLGLTNAAVAARGALTVLFGPVGLILAGVAALAYLATGSNEAKTSIDILAKSVDDAAAAFDKLGEAGQAKLIFDINKKSLELKKELASAEEDAAVKVRGGRTETALAAAARAEEIRAEIKHLKELRAELGVPAFLRKAGKEFGAPTAAPEINAPDIEFGDNGAAAKAAKDLKDAQDKEDRDRAAAHAADEIRGASGVTEQLKRELETRHQVSQFYREAEITEGRSVFDQQRALANAKMEEDKALIDQRAAEDSARREEQKREALKIDGLTPDEKLAIRAAYDQQALAADAVYQEQKNAIAKDGALTREQIDKMEHAARMANFAALGQNLMSLGEGQSRKVFETGKALALSQAAVALPSAVVQAYKNGGGLPWGAVAAGATLTAGLKQIQSIRSQKFGGGASVPSVSGGGGSLSGSVPTASSDPALPQFQQKRVVEIRGAIDGNSLVKISDLPAIMGDDSMVVLINGAQTDAQRRGVI